MNASVGNASINFDNAILLEILTTRYVGYRIRTEEDPKAHDSPIQ
jgi:hypothetical protein